MAKTAKETNDELVELCSYLHDGTDNKTKAAALDIMLGYTSTA
jgi:hypothetical protein